MGVIPVSRMRQKRAILSLVRHTAMTEENQGRHTNTGSKPLGLAYTKGERLLGGEWGVVGNGGEWWGM